MKKENYSPMIFTDPASSLPSDACSGSPRVLGTRQPVEVSAATTIDGQMKNTFISLGRSLAPDYEQQLGRVNIEWANLDYAMRIACKRLEDVGLTSQKGSEIMKCSTHGDIVQRLKRAAGNSRLDDEMRQELMQLIDMIGERRNEKLYARRNSMLHSIWALSDGGQVIRQRIGTDEWRQPVPVTKEELRKLLDEIQEVWQGLLRLTKPLLSQAKRIPDGRPSA